MLQDEKKEQREVEQRDRDLQQRACISIPLVQPSDDDTIAAKRVMFKSTAPSTGVDRRRQIRKQSVFISGKTSGVSALTGRLSLSSMDMGKSTRIRPKSDLATLRNKLGVSTAPETQ